MDESLSSIGSRAGLVLTSLEGMIAEYVLRFRFKTSNNEAENETLVTSLVIAKELDVQ